jgi:signal transduction histidine kinase
MLTPDELSLTARRRWVLRAGFAALLVLLGLSVFLAREIQHGLSDEASRTYHTYIQQEESLFNVRRMLWQSSVLVRDLLLDVSPDREAKFAAAVSIRRKEIAEAIADLKDYPIPGQDLERLNAKLAEYWLIVDAVPATTKPLNQAQRYDFVQNQIAARRVTLSELVREVSALSRSSLTSAEARLAANRQMAGWRLAGLIALALGSGMVFAILSLRRLNALEAQTAQQYEEVSRTKAELQALSAQLMSIQEIERARLSRELHDEIGQALATLRLELARLESSVRDDLPDIHGRLSRSRAIVDSTVKAVRNISLMLRPSLLDDLGLVAALQWLAEDSSRRTGIPCVVREENVSDDLPVDLRTCVYRVVQEALHNAEKHARAQGVIISLVQRRDELEIYVDDDGCGLDGGDLERWKTGAHLGILGMRERVAALEGSFAVGTAPEGGTRVEVRLPLAPQAVEV